MQRCDLVLPLAQEEQAIQTQSLAYDWRPRVRGMTRYLRKDMFEHFDFVLLSIVRHDICVYFLVSSFFFPTILSPNLVFIPIPSTDLPWFGLLPSLFYCRTRCTELLSSY
jgi:hypothetical protein